MPDVLIRDLCLEDKRALELRAARNGRSQQAEAKSILETALRSESRSWVSILRKAAQDAGGIEFEPPARHVARDVETGDWL